jgi:multicomponent Na+:H+ antiporter subunit B
MSERIRILLFGLPLLAAVPLALAALAQLPPFGAEIPAYGERIAAVALAERGVENLVAAVIFDYRGFDTLNEQFIIFAAVLGVALLFRDVRGLPGGEPIRRGAIAPRPVERSEAVTAAARPALAVIAVFGAFVVLHAHLTPGGGFQGGAILASALLLVFLGEGYDCWRATLPPAVLDVTKAVAALAYALLGLAGLAAGGAYLENVLPLGTRGSLASGGTIPLLNAAAGIGVVTGLLLLFHEYLAEVEPAKEDLHREDEQ